MLSQLTEEEPAPASPLALPATVAEMVLTEPSAAASMVTDSSAIKLLRVTVALRCDSMVLKPNAKAAAKPFEAAKPPAKDWMLEVVPSADSPALTWTFPAVTKLLSICAAVTSPISFQVAVPVKAKLPSLNAPEAATDWLSFRFVAVTWTSPLPKLTLALLMLAVLPALRLTMLPPFWTTVWPSTV